MMLPINESKIDSKPIWVKVLLGAVLILLAVYVAALTRNTLRQYDYIGRSDQQIYTITISGEGKVTAIPDIAEVSVGIETQQASVGAAQSENTTKMNELITQLKGLNISAEDIKTTNYNIYPRYDYLEGRQVLRGYVVSQNVTVKIRDLQRVAEVLELAGSSGVNQLGGLQFTIDEPEDIRQQAREEALRQATEKAEALAKIANVKLGKLVSFSENGYVPSYPVYARGVALDAGFGGAEAAPTVEPGSQEVQVNVTVTYEVL